MTPAKAAVAPRSDIPLVPGAACPVLDGTAREPYKAAVKASADFSRIVLGWLHGRDAAQKAEWMKASIEAGRALFQPWTMEILYALAIQGRTRFTEMQDLLGISSRTLSDKLKLLRDEGFVEREVFDEQPVRIEYYLTKRGRTTAALAAPLFAELSLDHQLADARRG